MTHSVQSVVYFDSRSSRGGRSVEAIRELTADETGRLIRNLVPTVVRSD